MKSNSLQLKPKNEDVKISRIQMRDAMLRSGYMLESRVETLLRNSWGIVESNPCFADFETGKSREYDLLATNSFNIDRKHQSSMFGILVVECVNNPQPIAVLTKKPAIEIFLHNTIKVAGLSSKIYDESEPFPGWTQISQFLKMPQYHHYFKGPIGSQYCSFQKKKSNSNKDEWMALHEGSHFESIRKLCDVVRYFQLRLIDFWKMSKSERVHLEFYYPVLVVQGELVEAIETKRSVKFRSADHIKFRQAIATADGRINHEYQIDIVRERYLPKYISMLKNECETTAQILNENSSVVDLSASNAIPFLKDSKSPDEFIYWLSNQF